MTDARAELREKVARAIMLADGCGIFLDGKHQFCEADCPCFKSADAAISVVLEEAARVCEAMEPPAGNTYTYGLHWEDGAGAAADAIRALIPSAS